MRSFKVSARHVPLDVEVDDTQVIQLYVHLLAAAMIGCPQWYAQAEGQAEGSCDLLPAIPGQTVRFEPHQHIFLQHLLSDTRGTGPYRFCMAEPFT